MNNDLISREALKNLLLDSRPDNIQQSDINFDTCDIKIWLSFVLKIIDNAPTVDIKDQIAGAYNEGYMCGNKEAEKARPQGEWNYIQAGMCVCPFCGAMPHKLYKNYCAKCGAELKGGAV